MTERIKVFFIDDHQIFRDGLRILLEAMPDFEVVGEAENGTDILAKMGEARPDVLLMDIQMPGENGIELTRQVKQAYPEINVLMLTMFEDEQSVFNSMQAGACGYVLKGINHREMLSTIRTVANGGTVFGPGIASRIMDYFQQINTATPTLAEESKPTLSSREQEVLAEIEAGLDNGQIAEKLFLSEKTVRNYVSQILKKLEVSTRYEAVKKAQKN
ncbi:MAG: response regulator [Anaerolineae bacterium]